MLYSQEHQSHEEVNAKSSEELLSNGSLRTYASQPSTFSIKNISSDEVLVSFSEYSQSLSDTLFSKFKSLLEMTSKIPEEMANKWPTGIPAGRIIATEGGCDLYVDFARQFNKGGLGKDVWSLSQLLNIKIGQGIPFLASFNAENYLLRASYLRIAVKTTPEEEGLIGACVRSVRISVVAKELAEKAEVISVGSNPNSYCYFDNDVIQDGIFDENIHWVIEKLAESREDGGKLLIFATMSSNSIAYTNQSVCGDNGEILLANMQVQPMSVVRMYRLFPESVQNIIDRRWRGAPNLLKDAIIQVTPTQGADYIMKLHDYYSRPEDVLAVFGAVTKEDGYQFRTSKGALHCFSESECELAALACQLGNGMLGICDTIAQLCYLKRKYAEGYDMFVTRMLNMARSGIVKGIDDFIRHTAEQVKIVELIDRNGKTLNGIFAEVAVTHNLFQKIQQENQTITDNKMKKFMRLSEKMSGSEFDIKIFRYGQMGEEKPLDYIEVKNTIHTLVNVLYKARKTNQFKTYIRETEKMTRYGNQCQFSIYIASSNAQSLYSQMFSRIFFENIKNNTGTTSQKLQDFLNKKTPNGFPCKYFQTKDTLNLILDELSQIRQSVTDREVSIGLYLWDETAGEFVKYERDDG